MLEITACRHVNTEFMQDGSSNDDAFSEKNADNGELSMLSDNCILLLDD